MLQNNWYIEKEWYEVSGTLVCNQGKLKIIGKKVFILQKGAFNFTFFGGKVILTPDFILFLTNGTYQHRLGIFDRKKKPQ